MFKRLMIHLAIYSAGLIPFLIVWLSIEALAEQVIGVEHSSWFMFWGFVAGNSGMFFSRRVERILWGAYDSHNRKP